jgi:TM2 domain-containing membrane protein YozV
MTDPYAGRNPYEPEPTRPLPQDPQPARFPAEAADQPDLYGPYPGQGRPPYAGGPGQRPLEPHAHYPQARPPYLPAVDPRQQAYAGAYPQQKSRVAAGLLAIFLGTLGIHNFYLGRNGIAVLQLLLTVLSLGFLAFGVAVWALIEGILILTSSPSFATDAKGVPLRS